MMPDDHSQQARDPQTGRRLLMHDNGFPPVPTAGKRALLRDWPRVCATASVEEIQRWSARYPDWTNTGALCGAPTAPDADGCLWAASAVDIDVLNATAVNQIVAHADTILGVTPLCRIGRAPKTLLVFRTAAQLRKMAVSYLMPNGEIAKVEILGQGNQFVAFGIHPDTHKEYLWVREGSPDMVPLTELPPVDEALLRRFLAAAEAALRDVGGVACDSNGKPIPEAPKTANQPPPAGRRFTSADDGGGRYVSAALEAECRAVAETREGSRNNRLNIAATKLGGFVANGHLGEEEVKTRLLAAALAAGLTRPEAEKTIISGLSYGKQTPRDVPRRDAPEVGSRKQKSGTAKPKHEKAEAAAHTDLDPDDLTEDRLALIYAERHANALRYCHDSDAWFLWDNCLWQRDRTRLAADWARELCRDLATETGATGKAKAALGRAATCSAVERLARLDRGFAATRETWDADPWLLGTPGGTVDLRTGILRPGQQSDHITKSTTVAPSETVDCSRWLQFMHEATNGDTALIRFLQQWAGYSLTGDTREQALLFVYGKGGNGKGLYLNTLGDLLGDYCRNAPMDTFEATKGDRHPTDLAHLHGARMVRASETSENRTWDSRRIKQATGGDPISARHMRQDFFEYIPTFKITVIGNYKPALSSVGDAERRRFNIVPFIHEPPEKDLTLPAKLREEWAGILRWAIEGCLDWQQNGLVRPKVVLDATADYFEAQDLLGQWIEERCEVTPMGSAQSSLLYADWSTWARERGEEPGTNKTFSGQMERQFQKGRDKNGVRFFGLKLQPSETGVW
ncbi:phage/plasmid primase, P4 family [Paracraurococcus lichenis]|uniref:Phage/plasmid primase, P4 family n=1 Tax=Paracraurococcus lichenis TaxID=3064888 RepID=A0ABT9E8A5_9PROT|nr:phage/plasmid primase, P4 family [Paracraurococcus sp. LOR1-02]MDO9712362.1 phage/plasmid primase, P4 family [Paracraurococcus sp. LOR1-02]